MHVGLDEKDSCQLHQLNRISLNGREIGLVFHAVAMLLSSSSSTCLQLARVLPCALQLLRHSSTVAENVKQWQAKATKELKGKDPLQTLAYETADVSSRTATLQQLLSNCS